MIVDNGPIIKILVRFYDKTNITVRKNVFQAVFGRWFSRKNVEKEANGGDDPPPWRINV